MAENEETADGSRPRDNLHALRPPPRQGSSNQGESQGAACAEAPVAAEVVTFDRREFRDILDLYGRKVAAGEWRDYAVDFTRERAIFSIFRRAAEYPLFRVVKDPRLAGRQGAFSVVTTTGLVLKRGSDLKRVLAVLDRKLKLVSG